MTIPTFSQIKAQVAEIRQKVPQAQVIGIHSAGRWTGESLLRDGDRSYAIHQCDSPLAFRFALREPTGENFTKVLITHLDQLELGNDILLRLAKRRLFQIDPWRIVRSLFDARAVDPRLAKHAWLAESLLELVPREGYPAARGGFLDAETVWPLLLKQTMDLQSDSPDLVSLLKWSLSAEAVRQFRSLSKEFREGATSWLNEKAGPVVEVLLHCIERLERPDAVPIGLAAGVIYHATSMGKLEKATGKLEERFLGGKSPESEQMQRWHHASKQVVRELRDDDSKTYRQVVQRADEILRDVQADGMAFISDISPLGFDQRLTRFGKSLSDVTQRGAWDSLDELVEARTSLGEHDLACKETRRLERVDMALRLVRWLSHRHARQGDDPQSFAEAARAQIHEGGFVDWARLTLRCGDPVQEVSRAYARLFEEARNVREAESQDFAKLLADWTSAGGTGEEVIPVERTLEEIVSPLAAEGLVMVVVIDGMSTAVCRELLADITRHAWISLSEPNRQFNRPAVATIPSVTEFSRTSLLCGKLCRGSQEHERAGFSEHPSLLAHCRSGSPPVLFHKATLAESSDSVLAAEVRKEIASTHRRVVGVVVNAVDDHLLKGEQLDTRWSRDEIRVLPALLHEARIARRLVVLISDHGHILDCQAEGRPLPEELPGGERWRSPIDAPREDELLVEGSRVLVEGNRLIAPWSERVRYGMKKNGYHGGLTPQEMIIPITVLSSTDSFPRGWSEQPIDTPVWWDATSSAQGEKSSEQLPPLKPVQPQPTGRLPFMEVEEPATVTDVSVPEWITRLLASQIFAEQKRLGGRNVPSDATITELLTVLDERGGKMTSVALARSLEFPAIRLPGLLAKVERVLNIDGYDVLRRDDASDTIELNRDLLLKQFDLVA